MDVLFTEQHVNLISLCWILFKTKVWGFLLEPLEPLLHIVFVLRRREKLALQFATKIAANPNNLVYETIFNPQYVDLFARKPRSHCKNWTV